MITAVEKLLCSKKGYKQVTITIHLVVFFIGMYIQSKYDWSIQKILFDYESKFVTISAIFVGIAFSMMLYIMQSEKMMSQTMSKDRYSDFKQMVRNMFITSIITVVACMVDMDIFSVELVKIFLYFYSFLIQLIVSFYIFIAVD